MTSEVYETINGVPLQIHIFPPKTAAPRPAVIFYHGGGWTGGSPEQFFPHARHFAERGLVAFSVQYRLNRERDDTTPGEAVSRAKSAYRWVRANAGRLGVDARRIVVSGSSAGGHLSAAVALLPGEGEPCDPAAMVLFNPVTDTTPTGYYPPEAAGMNPPLDVFSVCDPKLITTKAPVTLIFHPVADKLVPFENSQRFTALMTAAGARCQLVGVEGVGHGYIYSVPSNPQAVASLHDMDRFLVDLGYLR